MKVVISSNTTHPATTNTQETNTYQYTYYFQKSLYITLLIILTYNTILNKYILRGCVTVHLPLQNILVDKKVEGIQISISCDTNIFKPQQTLTFQYTV